MILKRRARGQRLVPALEMRQRRAVRHQGVEPVAENADRNVAHGERVARHKAVLAELGIEDRMAAVVLALEAAMAGRSRFSGGVRTNPQKVMWMAGPSTDNCQSIHWPARARAFGSAGSSVPLPCRLAR